uniref:1-phosphatidylinositol-4-phosphate 5-kinase n=1 Tax=Davidia involucrata TaxID=16924 RepID=A0A5B7B0N9_DAVIN
MHQKKSELQIGEESCGLSSDFDPIPPIFLPSILQNQSILHTTNHTPTQYQKHLKIQIPSPSSLQCRSSNQSTPSTPTQQNPKQPQFQNEPICNNPPSNKTLLSTPHKRPVMSQTPSTLSHSPTLSSLHHCHNTAVLDSEMSQPPFLCSSSSAVALATKAIALKVSRHFCCVRLLRVRLRFFILLYLPSLYFFTSNHSRAFLLDILSAIAFSAALVISFNLALPRLPSIRLLLARSFPIKLSSITTASNPPPPVVWSIGSKPKPEKRANSGSWVQVYSNGDVYEGEFHKGKCSGSGVYYYYMSGRYEGDWVDEKYDGHGVETWAKGSRYRGQYRQGLRHGFGVYRFYTGDVYAGEWYNGQCHGCGVHTCEDGSRYVGEFKWGVKHGLGHYNFRNGDMYAGEYFADKMHGFGVYCFVNGHRYEGAWHEGRKQGFGMYTFKNEETQSGHWQDGVLNVSSTQDTPGSPFSVDHLKVLNTVQEARRAAEKAYNGARVDERVNKAVAAANKAANAARLAAVKAVQNRMHHHNGNDDASSNSIV